MRSIRTVGWLSLLALAVGATSAAYARKPKNELAGVPNSYEAATGMTRKSTQAASVKATIASAAIVPLKTATSGAVAVHAPPAGNVLLRAQTDSNGGADSECKSFNSTQESTVFSETFTTAAATSYIEIEFSGQIYIEPGVDYDGAVFDCSVTQIKGGVTATVPCSATKEMPVMLNRSLYEYQGAGMMTAYHGFVLAEPAASTTVAIKMMTFADASGQVCFSNLILRY